MQTQFELTLKITGNSLDQVDELLAQAAGQRIMARHGKTSIEQMINIKQGEVSETVSSNTHSNLSDAQAQGESEAPKETKVRRKKATEIAVEASQEGKKVEAPAPIPQVKIATKDQAIQAVGEVNRKFGEKSGAAGIAKVKEVLAKFDVPSVSKMDPSLYGAFVEYCAEVCA